MKHPSRGLHQKRKRKVIKTWEPKRKRMKTLKLCSKKGRKKKSLVEASIEGNFFHRENCTKKNNYKKKSLIVLGGGGSQHKFFQKN